MDQDEKTTGITPEEESPVESVRETLERVAAQQSEEADTPAEAQETPPETEEEAPAEAAPAESEQEASPDPVEKPEFWDDSVAEWTSLSRDVQDHLVAHEKDRQEAIERDRLPDEVRNALSQVEADARVYGLTTDQAITRLVGASRQLAANPRHALAQLAQQYGVDLSQLADVPSRDVQTQQPDDPVQAILDAVDQRFAQYETRQQQAALQNTQNEIQEWAKETGADGALLRPHFDNVQHLLPAEMGRLAREKPSQPLWDRLQTAYDNVSRLEAKPVDVDALVAAKVAEALKAKSAEVDKAQKAAFSAPPAASDVDQRDASPGGTVRESLERSYRKLANGDAGRIQ